ncbi:MAG: hypothetical protein ACFFB2_06950 [Promethearchaeota archaeon]
MSFSQSSKRILVIGREVGPITQLLKERIPKVSVGAVDVLGNRETRFFADWKFSVEKQSPNVAIFRPKHRSLLELLYELTLVMLEDLEFDLLIPLTPFQTKPEYIKKLSRKVEVYAPNYYSLEKFSSAYSFLRSIQAIFPETIPQKTTISDLSEKSSIRFPVIYVSIHKTHFFPSKESFPSIRTFNQPGFLFPYFQIYCAFFIGLQNCVRFLGLQMLSIPHDHTFFFDQLERNALLPFSLPKGFTYQRIITYLSTIISQLRVTGMITIYFGLYKDDIFPLSCNILPDENFDLWERRSLNTLINYFFSPEDESYPHSSSHNFAFKLPIYSQRSIRIPFLPETLCVQRNLKGGISHPDYPLCAISGSASSSLEANQILHEKKKELLKIIPSKT